MVSMPRCDARGTRREWRRGGRCGNHRAAGTGRTRRSRRSRTRGGASRRRLPWWAWTERSASPDEWTLRPYLFVIDNCLYGYLETYRPDRQRSKRRDKSGELNNGHQAVRGHSYRRGMAEAAHARAVPDHAPARDRGARQLRPQL